MTKTLGEAFNGKKNNIDLIRFIAAMLVIFSHSVPISYGKEAVDILSAWTDKHLTFGGLAVSVFFVCGGFLILKSADSKSAFGEFAKARALRIFPSLWVFVVLMTLFLGPLVSDLPAVQYYGDTRTYKYLLNGVFFLNHELPGVFSNNVYGNVINGALWTLPVEFMCYFACYFASKLRLTGEKIFKYTLIPAAIMVIGCTYVFRDNTFILAVMRPIVLFYIGMLMYRYRDKIKLDGKLFAISIIAFALLIYFKLTMFAMLVFFPYIFMYLAFGTSKKADWFGKYGEFSYGIYLWGWPVQQLVCSIFGGTMDWYMNVAVTLPIVIVLGVANYYLVEKHMMRIGKK